MLPSASAVGAFSTCYTHTHTCCCLTHISDQIHRNWILNNKYIHACDNATERERDTQRVWRIMICSFRVIYKIAKFVQNYYEKAKKLITDIRNLDIHVQ